jgi:hypothetical protein
LSHEEEEEEEEEASNNKEIPLFSSYQTLIYDPRKNNQVICSGGWCVRGETLSRWNGIVTAVRKA